MRYGVPRVLFVLALASATACGGGGGGGGDDDDQPADAGGGGGPDSGDPPVPVTGFQIVSPDIELEPGAEETWCYYTTIPNEATLGVKRWSSQMTPGSHHLILYFTDTAEQPDGTLTQDCGASAGGALAGPVWTYSAQSPTAEAMMPAGVGMKVPAGQHAFVQMHYINLSDDVLTAHVTVNGEAYGADETYIPAAAFVTFNTQIDVPRGQEASAEGTCPVPADANFFALSTHAHRFSTKTWVRDGDAMVFESEDWSHPGKREWLEAPHFQFQNGLTYHCDYYQDEFTSVQTGDSARTDEMCMAVGYFFPAEGPIFCLNSFVVPNQ